MNSSDKINKYSELFVRLSSLVDGELNLVSVLSNAAALIHAEFGFWWTGFYIVKDGELILGPFQGPVACMHIAKGRGVCGTAWELNRTMVVPDVEAFPGHIACSSESKSEIVVPVRHEGEFVAELDIDSIEYAAFDEIDAEWLERIVSILWR